MRGLRWAVALAVLSLVGVVTACGGGGGGATSPAPSPSGGGAGAGAGADAADRFLSTYVTSDGRVLRHDQGDDIVSEGQAYGMLIAELAGRDQLVRTIWSWTRQHLVQPNGLLAFHASSSGHILDHQSAGDADTLAAYALLRYAGQDAPALHRAGRRLASAVLAHESVAGPGGTLLLAAGPWARAHRVVDASYWMPSVFRSLARLTGDRRWAAMTATSVRLVQQVTEDGRLLPPDWATLHGSRLVPTGSGGGSGAPQYGPDAQRIPLWFGTSCDTSAARLVAAWWRVLQQQSRSSALSLTLDGTPIDGSGSTVALLASAAAARAAGDTAGARNLEHGAEQVDEGNPTYYGAAWLALSAGLRSGRLAHC